MSKTVTEAYFLNATPTFYSLIRTKKVLEVLDKNGAAAIKLKATIAAYTNGIKKVSEV